MKPAVLVIMAWTTAAIAADQPNWTELASLFGHRVDSTNVTSFAKRYELRKTRKFDEGQFTPSDESYHVSYRRDLVDCIGLQVGGWTWGEAHWGSYSNQLPFGLCATNTRAQLIARLGVTNAGPDMWLISHYKVWPIFRSSTNTISETNKISELYIWDTRVILPPNPFLQHPPPGAFNQSATFPEAKKP